MYYRNFRERSGKLGDYGLKRVPDYTELAYKEAVSKLRYFLSGNYAPVYRSYGGSPSIKNLEDSELDIDKKYPVPYTPLKPRLTAKYTQLYADSLDNYSPYASGQAEASKPTPSSQDSATNPEVVHFIQKQEDYIEQLERESQYCRDELNNLLGKVKEVISENEHLHEAQKNKIISRMFDSYGGSETDDLDDVGDSTGLDSDAKVTPSKIRKSTKPARSTRLEGPNIVFESRISELEAHLTQANIDQKKLQDENNENKRKLAEGLVDSSCLDGFKRQIDNLQRDKSTLEAQVAKLKLALDQRDQSDSDLGSRLKRGSDVVEQQLREERNNLEAEVRRLKEELDSQRGKVRELCGEGARRAVQERSAAQQRYTAHLDELAHDLAAQYDNVSKLQLDLERQRRDEQDLKRELSMKTAAIEELKMELKSKTAGLQADLAQAHAEKASLDEELASARLAIERQQRQAKHETNRLNSEIQSLRQRLDRADADLVHSRRENLRLSEEIAKLEKDIKLGNLTPTSPIKDNKEKELSSMIVSMENKHAHTVAELEAMIQSQNGLMDKLTGECRLLTDKLDDASRRHKQSAESQPNRATNQNTVRRLKHQRTADSPFFQAPRKRVRFVEQEMAALQRQVDGISQTFHQPAPNLLANNYQAPPTHKPLAENISPVAAFTRNDNTRTDTTRDPKIKRQSSNSSIRGDGDDPTRTIRKQPSNELFSVGHADKVSVDNQNYADNQRQPPDKFEEKLDEATEKHEPKYSTGTYSTENHEDPNPLAETNQVYSEEPQYATDQSYDTDQNDYNQQPFESQPDTYGTQENQQLYESQPDTYGTQETPYTETYNQEQANYEGTDPVNYAQDYTQGQYANQEYPAQYAEQQNEGYTEQPYDYSTDPNYQNPINQNTLDPNYENQVNPEYENTADSNYQNPVDLNYQNPVDPNYNTQDQSYGATENYLATEQQYVENTNTGIANNSPNKIQS